MCVLFSGFLFSDVLFMLSQNLADGSWWKSIVTSEGFKWVWGPVLVCWGLKRTSLPFEMSQCRSRGGSHHKHIGGWEGHPGIPCFQQVQLWAGERKKKFLVHIFSFSPLKFPFKFKQADRDVWQRKHVLVFFSRVLALMKAINTT